MPLMSFGFAAIAGAGTELRVVGTLTELQSRWVVLSPNPWDVFGFAAVAGAVTELMAVGTLIELPSRWVVLSPNPKKLTLVPSYSRCYHQA